MTGYRVIKFWLCVSVDRGSTEILIRGKHISRSLSLLLGKLLFPHSLTSDMVLVCDSLYAIHEQPRVVSPSNKPLPNLFNMKDQSRRIKTKEAAESIVNPPKFIRQPIITLLHPGTLAEQQTGAVSRSSATTVSIPPNFEF